MMVPTPMVMARGGTLSRPPKSPAASLYGEVVEVDHARFRGEGGAGFVESDVSRAPDAQNLDVDAARLFDGAFVCRTEGFHFVRLQGAVGDVDVLRKDVHWPKR